MKGKWWKYLCIVLIFYTLIMGLLGKVPRLAIVNEGIRNLYFHVPMWFGMILILLMSVIYSIRYLRSGNMVDDIWAAESTQVGMIMGILGIITGMMWAQYTWGTYWHGDPKQNGAAIGLLIYFAYSILRGAIQDEQQRGRISAVYNIFAYACLIPLLFILPRLTDSMHPGSGGNPGFNTYDLDRNMRLVFYPSIIAWTLLGWWIVSLRARLRIVEEHLQEEKLEETFAD